MQYKMERIHKIIAANSKCSRREAEKKITDGRVCVNGTPATIGQSARLGIDVITVDGTVMTAVSKRIYLMLNKPCGYLCAVKDKRGRKTVMELVEDAEGFVFPVGRLDLNSKGLLLFTNDGEFANKIMHPSFNLQKTYEVKVTGNVDEAAVLLREPLEIDGYTVTAVSVKVNGKTINGGLLTITIAEGRNRQIRKMCCLCGLKVDSLKRISIGNLKLGKLKNGHWRYLTDKEVLSFGEGYIKRN